MSSTMSGIGENIISELIVKFSFKAISLAITIANNYRHSTRDRSKLHFRLMAQASRFETIAKLLQAPNGLGRLMSDRHRHTYFNVMKEMHHSLVEYALENNSAKREDILADKEDAEKIIAELEDRDRFLTDPSEPQYASWLNLKETRLGWAVYKKHKLEKLVSEIEFWGDILNTTCTTMVPVIMFFNHFSTQEMEDVAQASSSLDASVTSSMLIEQRQLERELEGDDGADRMELDNDRPFRPDSPSLVIDRSEVQLQGDPCFNKAVVGDEKDPLRNAFGGSFRRLEGKYRNQQVIVEFKQRPNPNAENASQSITLLNSLVRELRLGSKTDKFQVFDCHGYYTTEEAYGIVYRLPDSLYGTQCESLANILLNPALKLLLHENSLNRILLARALATTLYRLHSVQWVHKSLNPDNILIFGRQTSGGQIEFDWSHPYLVGFDTSRSNQGYSSRAPPDLKWETRAYIHPHYLKGQTPETRERYKKVYDLYSLGVILLEIGLVECFKHSQYRDSKSSLRTEDLKAFFIESTKELTAYLGPMYSDVVITCLRGPAFDVTEEDEKESCLLEAFQSEICEKLDQIRI